VTMTANKPWDTIIVGAGHNGLVAACYLARAGVDVTVLERDTVVGGAVSTVERWPGYRVDRGSSAHVMIRHTGIVEDLALDVTYQDLDPWGWTPYGDITFSVDLDTTCASIENACGTRDADAYRAFALDWGQRNAKVFDAFQGAPTPGRLGRAILRWQAGAGRARRHNAKFISSRFPRPRASRYSKIRGAAEWVSTTGTTTGTTPTAGGRRANTAG